MGLLRFPKPRRGAEGMDDLSAKLKKLFKPKPKGVFKGKGNVLGGALTVRPIMSTVWLIRTGFRSFEAVLLLFQAAEQSRPPSKLPPRDNRPDQLPPRRAPKSATSPAASKADGEPRRAQPVPSPQQSGRGCSVTSYRLECPWTGFICDTFLFGNLYPPPFRSTLL